MRCNQSKANSDVDIAIIGDSHAEHIFLGLAEALPHQNLAFYIREGVPVRGNPGFPRIIDYVASSPSIKTVIVNAYWARHSFSEAELVETLMTLQRAGKDLFVLDDIPDFPFHPFACKYQQAPLLPRPLCSRKAESFWDKHFEYQSTLISTLRKVPSAHLLNTAKYFCGQETCQMVKDGNLLYRDRHHLNMNGSRFLAGRLLEDYPEFALAVKRNRNGDPSGRSDYDSLK